MDSANSTPPYIEAIPIVFTMKGQAPRGLLTSRDFAASALPAWKLIMMWNTGSAPSGWTKCDGGTVNGVVTPNLLGKYLRGIPTTGTAPGTTYAGDNTHAHSTNHYHTVPASSSADSSAEDPQDCAHVNHTHPNLSSASLSTSAAATSEPRYHEVAPIMFTGFGTGQAAHIAGMLGAGDLNASLQLPRGIVGAVTDASPPSGWGHCDGGAWVNGTPTGYGANKPNMLSRFVKHVPNATTNGGATGGAASHQHTGASHQHTLSGTSNTVYQVGYTLNLNASNTSHTHTSSTPIWSAGAYATDSVGNLPPYYEVAFVVRD